MKKATEIIRKNIGEHFKILLALLAFISVLFSVLAFVVLTQPLTIEGKTIKNKIEDSVSFTYYTIVKPSTLYPDGGKINPEGIILEKLTEDFIINIKTSINTDNPVNINGEKRIFYKIRAIDLWEKDFLLLEEEQSKTEPLTNFIKDYEVHIDLRKIYDFIEKVEEETSLRHNYNLEIIQTLSANITDENGNLIHEINNEFIIPFAISAQYIKYIGNPDGNKVVTKSYVEEIEIIPKKFNLFGMNIQLKPARLWFGTVALLSILLFVFLILSKSMTDKNNSGVRAIEKLENKNKGRITFLTEKIDLKSATAISVDNMKDLFRLADEKDELIYKYSDNLTSIYYIVVSSTVYIYENQVNSRK